MLIRCACFRASLTVFLACLLILVSCNSGKFSADPVPAELTETVSQPVHPEFSLEQALDQLAGMQAPPGTDPAVFSTLKDAIGAPYRHRLHQNHFPGIIVHGKSFAGLHVDQFNIKPFRGS